MTSVNHDLNTTISDDEQPSDQELECSPVQRRRCGGKRLASESPVAVVPAQPAKARKKADEKAKRPSTPRKKKEDTAKPAAKPAKASGSGEAGDKPKKARAPRKKADAQVVQHSLPVAIATRLETGGQVDPNMPVIAVPAVVARAPDPPIETMGTLLAPVDSRLPAPIKADGGIGGTQVV
jgi:hypothetical protein